MLVLVYEDNFVIWVPLTGVDPDQVKVRYLTSGHFSPSSDGGSFSVKISWEKPTFNYSTLIFYKISYLSGGNNATSVELPVSPGSILERFSIECLKTKTKPITNQLSYSANLKL